MRELSIQAQTDSKPCCVTLMSSDGPVNICHTLSTIFSNSMLAIFSVNMGEMSTKLGPWSFFPDGSVYSCSEKLLGQDKLQVSYCTLFGLYSLVCSLYFLCLHSSCSDRISLTFHLPLGNRKHT